MEPAGTSLLTGYLYVDIVLCRRNSSTAGKVKLHRQGGSRYGRLPETWILRVQGVGGE